MENMKQKNFEAIKIYRLKEKIFNLKGLLAECLFIVNDVVFSATTVLTRLKCRGGGTRVLQSAV